MIRELWFIVLVLAPFLIEAQTSGAVLKAGFVWNDYQRDGKSILSHSQVGHTAGLEIRLGAEDITYFKLGGYYARLHMQPQDHPGDTKFFGIVNGFDG